MTIAPAQALDPVTELLAAAESLNNITTPLAAHLTLMHPEVGTALACLLETEAASGSCSEDHTGCTPDTCTTVAVLALARQLIGGAL